MQRSGSYLRTVCDYVHLNPERAKLLKADEPLRSYPWSQGKVGRHHGAVKRQETA